MPRWVGKTLALSSGLARGRRAQRNRNRQLFIVMAIVPCTRQIAALFLVLN